ncbi:MAG: spore protease YyaC [Bacilli bacterium]|nr:spore protease YyaC [Bacilli bacterium]
MISRVSERISEIAVKVNHTDPQAKLVMHSCLHSLLVAHNVQGPIVILCIGTDRSTGDALGPLVGSFLTPQLCNEACHIYGTLEFPVHAVNLTETITTISSKHKNAFVIAVDACLGQVSSVGSLTIAPGPLKPGAGVQKELPLIGDIHVTGVVNVGGFMEYIVLQNTRLSIVMSMAELISDSIIDAIHNYLLVNVDARHLVPLNTDERWTASNIQFTSG